jgi:ribosomal protein S18 acetylase RimI-like enzyme
MAANRGCRLVRSRVRTPGKSGYGKFGLKDAKSGKTVFGLTRDKPTATADEIETFLRGGASSEWRRSLGKTKPSKAKAEPKKTGPKPTPPEPEPELVIRAARPADAAAITALIVALGYEVEAADVRRRMVSLVKAGHFVLVAAKGALVGVLTTSTTAVLHRPKPVGRISMLVVAEAARGAGIGRALVTAAEERLRKAGCGLVEVTSNVKRLRAHAFYRKLGYERTSYRFGKQLDL